MDESEAQTVNHREPTPAKSPSGRRWPGYLLVMTRFALVLLGLFGSSYSQVAQQTQFDNEALLRVLPSIQGSKQTQSPSFQPGQLGNLGLPGLPGQTHRFLDSSHPDFLKLLQSNPPGESIQLPDGGTIVLHDNWPVAGGSDLIASGSGFPGGQLPSGHAYGPPAWFWMVLVAIALVVGLNVLSRSGNARAASWTRHNAIEILPGQSEHLDGDTDESEDTLASASHGSRRTTGAAAAAAGSNKIRCAKCQVHNELPARFCKHCGTSLLKTTACRHCGDTIAQGCTTCEHCGNSIP